MTLQDEPRVEKKPLNWKSFSAVCSPNAIPIWPPMGAAIH